MDRLALRPTNELNQLSDVPPPEAELGLRECPRLHAGHRPSGGVDDVAESLVAACSEFTDDRPEESLCVRLSSDLRARDKGRMAAWRGYLWFLLSGLNKLPPVATRVRTFAGVVFRILGTRARDVRGLSYVEGELVLLLSPNVTLRVSAPLHDEGGAFFIDLAEESPDDVDVF
eukprot:m51a1_g12452 hypothetical protein (173) ;mRNA; f:1183-1788